jgi:two-component system cell cycle sensor histidine kinase/response regulator CckA
MKIHSAKILLADDEPAIRRAASMALSRAGYNVTTVADGRAAWKTLGMETFDLLITDNQMPRLTGPELVLTVRQHGLDLPIIVAASQLEFFLDTDSDWFLDVHLLQKPFGLLELMDAVERILCGAHCVH